MIFQIIAWICLLSGLVAWWISNRILDRAIEHEREALAYWKESTKLRQEIAAQVADANASYDAAEALYDKMETLQTNVAELTTQRIREGLESGN